MSDPDSLLDVIMIRGRGFESFKALRTFILKEYSGKPAAAFERMYGK